MPGGNNPAVAAAIQNLVRVQSTPHPSNLPRGNNAPAAAGPPAEGPPPAAGQPADAGAQDPAAILQEMKATMESALAMIQRGENGVGRLLALIVRQFLKLQDQGMPLFQQFLQALIQLAPRLSDDMKEQIQPFFILARKILESVGGQGTGEPAAGATGQPAAPPPPQIPGPQRVAGAPGGPPPNVGG